MIQTTHTWEPTRNVLDVKENKVGSTVVSSYDYSVNDLGQRTAVDTAGPAFTAGERDRTWSYDALGQVTAESDANNGAFNRGFAYDAIGNRTASIEGNTDTTQAGATNYTPTALNQYDAIGVFSPTYDDDGNQLESQIRPLGSSSLESCVFVWDSENRLIEIKDAAGTTTLASYTYDSQSRRIARTVGTTSIVTLYDAWNPIAEYTGTPATGYALQASYLWGLDLSGSMQGAGGVGGLLSVTSGAGTFYPTYDGNGNVSEYLDGSGVVVAHYEYDAFGNVIFSSGASAASFQHRFSTKPQDAESGLYYYGYRYLDPVTGRWPSRDPIEERGGVNLYGFVFNVPVASIDILGGMTMPTTPYTDCRTGMVHFPDGKKYCPIRDEMIYPKTPTGGGESGSTDGFFDKLRDLITFRVGWEIDKASPPIALPPIGPVTPFLTIGAVGEVVCCRKENGGTGAMFVGGVYAIIDAGVGTVPSGALRTGRFRSGPRQGDRYFKKFNNGEFAKYENSTSGGLTTEVSLDDLPPCATTADASGSLKAYLRGAYIVGSTTIEGEIGKCSISGGCEWTLEAAVKQTWGISSVEARAGLELVAEGGGAIAD